ncbi:hypothetical protein JCM13664_01300 [Methylothermus subterraneus]
MKRLPIPLLTGLILASPSPWAGEGSAKLYRWVDEQGKVHYSDTVPAEAAKHERVIYDKSRARKLEVVAKPKTPEELAREAQLAELREAEKRLLEEQLARDQALLRTYRNEEELQLAFNGQLDTITTRIKVLTANLKRLQAQLDRKIQEAAASERRQGKVPQALPEAIAAIRQQIQQLQAKIDRELNAQEELKRKFAQDLARFRNLKARLQEGGQQTATTRPDSQAAREQEIVLSVFQCRRNVDCEQAWQLAKMYLQAHATTPLLIASETLLHTDDPHQDQDIALTVARIQGKEQDTLFLDVRCKLSGIGQALCQGERVREIRAGFANFIQTGLARAQQGADALVGE